MAESAAIEMTMENIVTGSRAEFRGLQYWMERVLQELGTVRESPEPDAVHDLRVAIRRCRSVAAVIEEVDPDSAWPEMRKLGRKLFRQLGELRDTQVLKDWTMALRPEADALGEKLLAGFATQEKELQQSSLKAVEKFDQKSWKRLQRKLQRRIRLVPVDGLAAECLAVERLDAAKELHMRALRAEKSDAWHALRIGVKRFRYTVESLLPARYEDWGENLKRIQDVLGEMHDLDVLSAKIAESGSDLQESRTAWEERISSQRHERIETYRRLAIGEGGVWQNWRRALPEGGRLASAAQARLRSTAKAMEVNTQRATQVSRIAMRLFDGLIRLRTEDALENKDLRKIMMAAARLHGIGQRLDGKSPQKAARTFLKKLPIPPGWTETEWEKMAYVVRYHRGSLPSEKQKIFSRLDPKEQKQIRFLAGVLRLARSLGKLGVPSTKGMHVEKSVDAIIVHIAGLVESEQNAAKLAAGKYLLESSLGRPLIVRAAPLVPKLVELPRKGESPMANAAAASD